ncbi:putative TonB-dependent receptor BfrD precursor [compost metagenome]
MSQVKKSGQAKGRLIINASICSALVVVAASTVSLEVQAQTQLPAVEVKADSESYKARETVTATKTDTALRDIPQSINVVTKKQIDDQAAQSLAEALLYVPGVGFAQGEGNRETPIFRGVSTTGDFFVDGIRDDVQYYRDLYNIERVEVFKGPNAMIFGRGATGGLINRVTKTPNQSVIRDASVTLGSNSNRRATVDINQAISESLSFRLNGMYEDSDSYRNGVNIKRKGINPTVLMRLAPKTNLTLGYEHFEDDRIADRGITSFNGRPVRTDPSTFFGNAAGSPSWTKLDAFSALLEHTFDNGVELRNRTRWADQDKFYQNVFASGAASGNTAASTFNVGAYNNMTTRRNFFNQTDLIFNFNTGGIKHKFLVGTEFGEQETTNFRQTGTFTGSSTATLGNPTNSSAVTYAQSASDANSRTKAKIAALYLQDQIELTKQLQLVAGLRYDKFTVDFRNNRNGATTRSDDGLISPRVGLVFKPIEPLSLYANYSIAYQPRAGEQLGSLSASDADLKPEKFKNLEVGAKWDVTDRLAATAALYRLERSNMRVLLDPNNPNSAVLTDGQRTDGFELGLTGYVTRQWSVSGGYAYTDATFTKNISATVLAGARLPMVPKNTYSLWNRYDFTERVGAGLGVIHRTKSFAANEATPASSNVTLPGYTRVDAAMFVKLDKNWRAQLNVENLFDKDYYLNAHNNTNITPGSPRAFRVTLNASF